MEKRVRIIIEINNKVKKIDVTHDEWAQHNPNEASHIIAKDAMPELRGAMLYTVQTEHYKV